MLGPETGEDAPAGAIRSDRDGIGLSSVSQAIVSPSQVVDARKSVAVTDQAILGGFTLQAVMDQLATQNGNPAFTGTQLFRQLWETQNAAVGPADLQPSAHCSDNGTSLNGFPNVCRPTEGAQANAGNITNITSYSAIGLFNRFDLAPGSGADCGEYRVVFGKTGAGPGRAFIIFEAVLPNPRLALGLEGCRQVQAFWRDLTNTPVVATRATLLRNFYFNGLPGYLPVIHMNNYGFNPTSAGQVRVNMFMSPPWDLKEFKLERQCPGGVCKIKAVPVTVKVNPFGDLFNPASFNVLAGDFQTHFLTQVTTLALNDINRFNYVVPDQFNVGQSDSQSFGTEDDYLGNFGTGANAFRTAIQNQLTAISSSLTPDQIVARAQALSCGGCHQRSNGAAIGGGLAFPSSAGFVHNTEFTETGPDGTRFQLSPALTGRFLPFRKSIIEEFLSAVHPVTVARFDVAASAADAKSVYWVENSPSGSVVKASLNSGSEQAIAFGRANPTAVATDGVNAYWTETVGTGVNMFVNIFKVSVNGGTVTTLDTGVAGLKGIGTDGTHLYFTQNGNSIVRMLTSGPPITPCIVGRAGVTGLIAVEPTVGPNFYWQEGNNIVRAAKTCGSVVPFLTSASITGLATDGIDLYWAESPGIIFGMGGIVFSGSSNITSLAVGATNIAWISHTGSDLVLTKPKN